MINNRCLYFHRALKIQNNGNGPIVSDALYAVDQSQQTGPSDQSEQSRLTERRGLERLNLRTVPNESFANRWKMR